MNIRMVIWSCVIMVLAVSTNAGEGKFDDVLQKKKSFGLKRFPIGFYTDRLFLGDPEIIARFSDGKEVKDWSEIGCSLMFSPRFNSENSKQKALMKKILQDCEKNDIKMLLADRRFYPRAGTKGLTDEEYKKEVKAIGDYFSTFSSFLGFMISDEPGKKNLKNVLHAAKMQREALPKKHPFINLGFEPSHVGKKSWEDYFGSVINGGKLDVLSYDIYAQMLDDTKISSYYFMVLRNLRESSVRNGVPFWTILLATPHLYFVTPTSDDLLWQFNTAVCHGSSGVFWWFYYDGNSVCANYRNSPIDWNWDKTESWHYFKRIHQKFHRQYGDLFNRLASTRVTHYPKMVGGITWTPNAILKKIQVDVKGGKDVKDAPVLIGEFIDKDKQTYLMVVNNSRKKNISVKLTFPDNSKIYHYVKGVETAGNALEYGLGKHWLAPGQEVVYRIDAKAVKSSSITKDTSKAKNEKNSKKLINSLKRNITNVGNITYRKINDNSKRYVVGMDTKDFITPYRKRIKNIALDGVGEINLQGARFVAVAPAFATSGKNVLYLGANDLKISFPKPVNTTGIVIPNVKDQDWVVYFYNGKNLLKEEKVEKTKKKSVFVAYQSDKSNITHVWLKRTNTKSKKAGYVDDIAIIL